MTYQAIARKWRPTTFEQMAGQSHVTRTLRNALLRQRIHHAYLFTGPRGVGKTTAARALARSLNCLERGPTPDPCGACTSCREILSGSSPDVIEIDGASNNSVDDVRELRESVGYLPALGRYKVYIVDEVHMLSRGAFNALLKTLEEPPPHVVFVFATTEPQKIPDTVLSRVQRFDFKRIPVPVVAAHLRTIVDAEGVRLSDVALRLVARAGDGSMRDAQSLLDQVIAFGGADGGVADEEVARILGLVDRGLLLGMLEGLLRDEPGRCLEAIDQVYTYGYDLSQFTAELMEMLRNAALVSLGPEARRFLDVSDDELDRLEKLARGVPADTFSRYFQVLLDVADQVARSEHPKLVLEMSVARLASIRPVQPVELLLTRLEGLERRLAQGGARAGSAPREQRSRPRGPVASADDADGEPSPAATAARAGPTEPAAASPADLEAGFRALLKDLRAELRLQVLAEHAALVGVADGVARLALSSERSLGLARDLAGDPAVLALVQRHLGARRLELSLRQNPGQGTTGRERRDRSEAAFRALLWDEARADDRILLACAELGATIEDVIPLTRPEEP